VKPTESKAATGVAGLDDILAGGLRRGRVYLLEGSPGTGKTTIASQFLLEGAQRGESGLYITLSETETELRESASSHGWDFDRPNEVFELVPPENLLDDDQQQSLLYSSDLELGETTKRIFEVVERVQPKRVVLDSLSEIRLLAQSSLRYRRQILALKHYFSNHDATVLMLDDLTTEVNDKTVHSGSSTLVLGPAGTGKSLLTLTFAVAAVERGEKAAMFIFDEELGLLFERSKGLGLDLQAMVDGGRLIVEQVDAAELAPGEFAHRVRCAVETDEVSTIVIDSLNGYQASMPHEQALILHMHELLQFLNRQGVSTFLTVAQHGLVGDMKSPVDVTYLADTVILLRYFEAAGRVRRAISVIKKRTSAHEDTIREYRIGADGITLGGPLENFHGVLRGVPQLIGDRIPSFGNGI
jgi:KaiC/GvpD/RAD55 family RecA-like ATPase